jgi:hypothetical protein
MKKAAKQRFPAYRRESAARRQFWALLVVRIRIDGIARPVSIQTASVVNVIGNEQHHHEDTETIKRTTRTD